MSAEIVLRFRGSTFRTFRGLTFSGLARHYIPHFPRCSTICGEIAEDESKALYVALPETLNLVRAVRMPHK